MFSFEHQRAARRGPPNPYTGLITWATGEGSGPSEVKLTLQVLDTGLPRGSDTGAPHARRQRRKLAPDPATAGGSDRSRGTVLVITNQVTDPDLPKQRLTFSLGSGAPLTAPPSIRSPACSAWQPAAHQGGKSYRLTFIVTDDGTPRLSASQSIDIVVRDTRTDSFCASVPPTSSPADPALYPSTSMPPRISAKSASISRRRTPISPRLDWQVPATRSAQTTFEPAGEGIYRTRIEFDPTRLQSGLREIGKLHFDTAEAIGRSSVGILDIQALSGIQLGGDVFVADANERRGRVFIIENEPLLDTTQAANGDLTLTVFGKPGTSYVLQHADSLQSTAVWTDLLFRTTHRHIAIGFSSRRRPGLWVFRVLAGGRIS